MSITQSSSDSFSSDDDEEFFDAKSMDIENILDEKNCSNDNQQKQQNIVKTKQENLDEQQQQQQQQISNEITDLKTNEKEKDEFKKPDNVPNFPVPPPRRKKLQSNLATNAELTAAIPTTPTTTTSSNLSVKAATKNTGRISNLTKLVEEIASIQGDLSVNDAFLSQFDERKSVTVDEITNSSSSSLATSTIDGSTRSTISPKHDKPALNEKESTTTEQKNDDVMIRNIDTGEFIAANTLNQYLPTCLNPLNDHLLQRSIIYPSEDDDESSVVNEGDNEDDDENESNKGAGSTVGDTNTLSKREQLKSKVKKLGHGIIRGVRIVRKDNSSSSDTTSLQTSISGATGSSLPMNRSFTAVETDSQNYVKLKVNRKKGTADFEGLRVMQEINDCKGAIWCMKWSVCGQLLAVAGQDQLLRVYCCYKAWKYFTQLRNKASGQQQISPNSTRERSFNGSRSNSISSTDNISFESLTHSIAGRNWMEDYSLSEEGPLLLFTAYRAHTADVLDISWSKNHFLLSSSMDKTVRLWHITRIECLCTFRHIDFVTTIQFHPRDDRYFLSGSLDGKLRLWNIPDKKVTLWNEVMALPAQNKKSSKAESTGSSSTANPGPPNRGLITSSAFVQNGKFAVIGTYDGRVIFFSTDQLKYSTQINVSASKSLSSRTLASTNDQGKRNKRNTQKVTGIEGVDDTKILVTTNDSRVRLFDLRDLSLVCKYKGCVNYSSQIRASVSHDNKYIVCGSENSSFYIWRLMDNTTIGQRKDRNNQWESVKIAPSATGTNTVGTSQASASNAQNRNAPNIITSATFAPVPNLLDEHAKYIIAIADFNGCIKLFLKSHT